MEKITGEGIVQTQDAHKGLYNWGEQDQGNPCLKLKNALRRSDPSPCGGFSVSGGELHSLVCPYDRPPCT